MPVNRPVIHGDVGFQGHPPAALKNVRRVGDAKRGSRLDDVQGYLSALSASIIGSSRNGHPAGLMERYHAVIIYLGNGRTAGFPADIACRVGRGHYSVQEQDPFVDVAKNRLAGKQIRIPADIHLRCLREDGNRELRRGNLIVPRGGNHGNIDPLGNGSGGKLIPGEGDILAVCAVLQTEGNPHGGVGVGLRLQEDILPGGQRFRRVLDGNAGRHPDGVQRDVLVLRIPVTGLILGLFRVLGVCPAQEPVPGSGGYDVTDENVHALFLAGSLRRAGAAVGVIGNSAESRFRADVSHSPVAACPVIAADSGMEVPLVGDENPGSQCVRQPERVLANRQRIRRVVFKDDFFQPLTAVEAVFAHGGYALWNRNGSQASAAAEGAVPNGGHAGRQADRGDPRPVRIPRAAAVGIVVHSAAAGDGEHTVPGQGIGQVSAAGTGVLHHYLIGGGEAAETVMIAVPTFSAVTLPSESTVATDGSLLTQV